MIGIAECARAAGLDASELVVGVPLSTRHETLYASYLFSMHRGTSLVRQMIVSDQWPRSSANTRETSGISVLLMQT